MKILRPQEPGSRRPGAQSAGLVGPSPAHPPSGTRPAADCSVEDLVSRYLRTMPQCLRGEPAGGCPGISQSFVARVQFLTQLPSTGKFTLRHRTTLQLFVLGCQRTGCLRGHLLEREVRGPVSIPTPHTLSIMALPS